MKIGLIIPTLNAGKNFEKLLEQITQQKLQTKNLIIDSESTDDTVGIAKKFNFEVLTISRKNFHHGATRQLALEYLVKKYSIEIAIFLTQDVLLYDENSFAELVKIFYADKRVGLCYGRQLPHKNATFEAKILRKFNYPEESQLRIFADKKFLGLKVATASNSFAAYRVEFLQKIGGFPEQVILSEDMFAASKMLISDYKIFYNADAKVYHSHNYTIIQEFQRYFDIGVFHARENWIRKTFGSAEGTGKKFIFMKLTEIIKNDFFAIFGAIFRDEAKLLGYRLGLLEKYIPKKLCKILSMNKNFWR